MTTHHAPNSPAGAAGHATHTAARAAEARQFLSDAETSLNALDSQPGWLDRRCDHLSLWALEAAARAAVGSLRARMGESDRAACVLHDEARSLVRSVARLVEKARRCL
ncbi:MAG TPA: hypothetical protein VNT60_05020 [Deinococcales bacterium]|nr:hypothetical protein [Deinococcales bacterium]